jgi:hypothetical protein
MPQGIKDSIQETASKPSYGKDLWDCITILTENTQHRTQQMKSLRVFFSSIKKSLELFSQSLAKANQQFAQEFVFVKP